MKSEIATMVGFELQDACYRLYDRPLHPELFHIYQSRLVKHDRYTVSLWLTGCSHVIQFSVGDQTLTELVGPLPEELADREALHGFQFRGEKNIEDCFEPTGNYYMSSQVERMSPTILLRTHRDLWTHGSSRRLFQCFVPQGDSELRPFALLDYEARMREFHVTAFHCFPSERAIVKTQCIFEAPRKPR